MKTAFKAGDVLLVRDVPEFDDEDEAFEDAVFLSVAITTKFDEPVAPPCVKLASSAGHRCRTGLTENSVANCEWRLVLPVAGIIERSGYAGDRETNLILGILAEMLRRE